MHVPALDADIRAIAQNISRLTALGMQVHITELDVSLPIDSTGQPRPADMEKQAKVYRDIVRACLASRGCTAIETWGFSDKYSWIGSHTRGARGGALPFDRSYQPKPAYRAIEQELSAGRPLR
jgi:endo-1,4-beta-xylanase